MTGGHENEGVKGAGRSRGREVRGGSRRARWGREDDDGAGLSNARDDRGQSPLHLAAASAFVDGVRVLVRLAPLITTYFSIN